MRVLFQWLQQFTQWLGGLFRKEPGKPEHLLRDSSSGITFYTVYIPTLDGRFFYLGMEAYVPGEVVVVPFGQEDRQILGIVEEVRCYPYGKTPLPMWKMKYILETAPLAITEEYQRLKKD